jgi:MFS family permease
MYVVWMRPDPLLESRRLALAAAAGRPPSTPALPGVPGLVRVAIISVAASHLTMVALMSMTPVHLVHTGSTLSIVGFTISMHIAGMFAVSPVFGVLTDRLGPLPVVALGQLMLVAAIMTTALGQHQHGAVLVGLILLGLGWSASTVAGSALLNEAASPARRVVLQGRSDLLMNLVGAMGGAASGPLFATLGYAGLAWTLVLPVVVVAAGIGVGQRLVPARVGD